MTTEFDRITSNRVSTLTTDGSFSWIVSKPVGYYNPARYLSVELLTQVLVAVGIIGINFLLGDAQQATKIGVILIAAALTAASAYGQLINWWGLTLLYAIGVSLTVLVGWGLAI